VAVIWSPYGELGSVLNGSDRSGCHLDLPLTPHPGSGILTGFTRLVLYLTEVLRLRHLSHPCHPLVNQVLRVRLSDSLHCFAHFPLAVITSPQIRSSGTSYCQPSSDGIYLIAVAKLLHAMVMTVVWGGHTGTKAGTLDKYSTNINFDEQIAAIYCAKRLRLYV